MIAKEPTCLRKIRGIEIARKCRITKKVKGWHVPSQSGHGRYTVKLSKEGYSCTCLDFEMRHVKCKHIFAVEAMVKKLKEEGRSVRVRKTYPQKWSAYDKAQQNEKQMFMELMADMCDSIEEPDYGFGRPKLSLKDMTFCCAFKVYSLYSLRRFHTDIKSAKEEGYIGKVPCFASIGHFFQREDLTQILLNLIEKSSLPLKSVESEFAIDSSGFSSSRFARYFNFRHGRDRVYKSWIKAHLVCGVKTNIVTAVKLTESNVSDVVMFNELVSKTSDNFDVKEVSADKGYLSKDNYRLVNELGGKCFIPFKKNITGRSRGSGSYLWKKMFHYFMYNNEDFMKHYNKRSNVETVFHMIKSKFGDSVKSKTRTAQINEILCKVLCHNVCVIIQEMHELGIDSFGDENGP